MLDPSVCNFTKKKLQQLLFSESRKNLGTLILKDILKQQLLVLIEIFHLIEKINF